MKLSISPTKNLLTDVANVYKIYHNNNGDKWNLARIPLLNAIYIFQVLLKCKNADITTVNRLQSTFHVFFSAFYNFFELDKWNAVLHASFTPHCPSSLQINKCSFSATWKFLLEEQGHLMPDPSAIQGGLSISNWLAFVL